MNCRELSLVIALGLLIGSAAAEEPAHDVADGWTALFDGRSLDGWRPVGGAEWRVTDGAIATNGDKAGWLMTEREFADFELHVEFKAPATTNSGIFLRTVLEPTDPTKDCCELNIAPRDNPFPTASLVGRQRLSTQPQRILVGNSTSGIRPAGKSNSEIDVWDGKWHAFDVVIDGDSVRISLDRQCLDTVLLSSPEPQTPRRGHIGLQAKEGPVAFRNVRVRESGSR